MAEDDITQKTKLIQEANEHANSAERVVKRIYAVLIGIVTVAGFGFATNSYFGSLAKAEALVIVEARVALVERRAELTEAAQVRYEADMHWLRDQVLELARGTPGVRVVPTPSLGSKVGQGAPPYADPPR